VARNDFMDPLGHWECIKCGACCKLAGLVLPDLDRGDGGCKHLLRDNTCEIYDNRPDICRVPGWMKQKPLELADACNEVVKIAEEKTTNDN